MTDERIYQLMELARSYRLEGGMKLNLARLVEEEVRKEQAEKIAELKRQLADANKAIYDAATSMHTISTLAGLHKTDAGNTFMGTFPDVRAYAKNRANVAREAINSCYLQPHVKAAHEAIRAAIAAKESS